MNHPRPPSLCRAITWMIACVTIYTLLFIVLAFIKILFTPVRAGDVLCGRMTSTNGHTDTPSRITEMNSNIDDAILRLYRVLRYDIRLLMEDLRSMRSRRE